MPAALALPPAADRAPVSVAAGALGWRALVDPLILVGIALLFSLSNYALDFFGIPYDSSGGSIVTKIHPSTYVFALALALAVFANPSPLHYAARLLADCAGSTALLFASLLLWYFISRFKPDQTASFLIDALMVAGIVRLLFNDAGEGVRRAASWLVHLLLVANCVLAIVEGVSGWRLFPFAIGVRVQTWDYRATALLGHPLVGALVTGVYAVILMTVRDVRGLAPGLRLPILLLCVLTLPFLGARTSFAVVCAVALGVALWAVLNFLRGRAVSLNRLMAILVALPLGVGVVLGLVAAGFFDNFIERFTNDSGSAETRVALFTLFDGFGLRGLLVGYGGQELATRVRLGGLTEGIENAWAGHLLRYGLVMSLVLWAGIAGWFADMARACGRGAVLPLLFVVLVNTTSVGVSAKTTMLVVPAIVLLALVAPTPRRSARGAPRSAAF